MPDVLGYLQMYGSWHILLLICVLDVMFIAMHFGEKKVTFTINRYGDIVSRTSDDIVNEIMEEQLKLSQTIEQNIQLITNLTSALKTKDSIIRHLTKEMEQIEEDIALLKSNQEPT